MKKISTNILIILLLIFIKCSGTTKGIDFKAYTNPVEVMAINANKKYAKQMYGVKLDRIVFEIAYTYNQREYESNVTMHWQYLSPKLIEIVDKKAFEKLIVKCKNNTAKEVMIFVKD